MESLMRFDWAAWWATVTPEFALLLGLPWAVAVAGWAATRRKERPD